MEVISKRVFRTEDGREFDSKKEAQVHEQHLGLVNICLSAGCSGNDARKAAEVIAHNWSEILAFMTTATTAKAKP